MSDFVPEVGQPVQVITCQLGHKHHEGKIGVYKEPDTDPEGKYIVQMNDPFLGECCALEFVPVWQPVTEGTEPEEMITITKKEYDSFQEDAYWRTCVENAGVDNWDGFGFAMDDFYGRNDND